MKKVLVTGGCGFLGSHVCEYFKKQGWDVVSYDSMTKYELKRNPYGADAARDYNWAFLEKLNVKLVKADVRKFDELMSQATGCDYIVHTAAQPAVTISAEDPELDFTTNVVGTFNVLNAARKLKIPVATCATIHVYGNEINRSLCEGNSRYLRKPEAIDESYPLLEGKLSPLHASKATGDTYVRTFIDTFGVEAASFRLTGLYGPRQFGGEDHGWVANFAIRAVLGLPMRVFNNGKQVRDILYAVDAAKAFMAFYERRVPGIYNIGSEYRNSISLIECIDLIGELLGKKPVIEFAGERFGDLYYFVCDSNKARKQLGWEAKVTPREGVSELIKWVKAENKIFKYDWR